MDKDEGMKYGLTTLFILCTTLLSNEIQVFTANTMKIDLDSKTQIEEVLGDDSGVTKIKFQGGEGKHSGKELDMQGVFMEIGHDAQTELAQKLGVDLNERKEIKINRRAETNLRGVFGAGDCCDTEFKQAITGSAEAVTASYYAYHVCSEEACF